MRPWQTIRFLAHSDFWDRALLFPAVLHFFSPGRRSESGIMYTRTVTDELMFELLVADQNNQGEDSVGGRRVSFYQGRILWCGINWICIKLFSWDRSGSRVNCSGICSGTMWERTGDPRDYFLLWKCSHLGFFSSAFPAVIQHTNSCEVMAVVKTV